MRYIYTLSDPQSPNKIRYIGCTKYPDKRLCAHIALIKCRDWKSPHSLWMKEMAAKNRKPLMRIVEEVKGTGFSRRESEWIEFYLLRGYPITNTKWRYRKEIHRERAKLALLPGEKIPRITKYSSVQDVGRMACLSRRGNFLALQKDRP